MRRKVVRDHCSQPFNYMVDGGDCAETGVNV